MTAPDTTTDDDEKTPARGWIETATESTDETAEQIDDFLHALATGDATKAELRELEISVIQTLITIRDAAETNGVFDAVDTRLAAAEDLLLAALCVDDGQPAEAVRERTGSALAALGPMRSFRSVRVTPQRVQAYVGRERVDRLAERTLSLHATDGGVTLATEGAGGDETAGSLVELDADQARLVADALYQAAAEMDGGDA